MFFFRRIVDTFADTFAESDVSDELRKELAAANAERARLASMIGKLERTLADEAERRARESAAIERVRDSAATQAHDLAAVVEQLARMCTMLAERVEAERDERRALVEALTVLGHRVSAPEPPRERVLGGSFEASDGTAPDVVPDEGYPLVDVLEGIAAPPETDPSRLAVGDAVRCRFGDHWIDDLEICAVNENGNGARYRVRRRSNRYMLPAHFTADELERAMHPASGSGLRGPWTRS